MPRPRRRFRRRSRIPARNRRCPARSTPRAKGLIVPILVGPAATIAEIAKAEAIDLGGARIVDVPHSHAAAAKAVELVRLGEAELLMKGSLHTDEMLGAVVARETGLRTGRRLSHVFLMDVPTYHKVLIVTDAAINIAPTLEDKVDICQNAIDLAMSLGVEQPKVAILAAVETVNSKMPATHRRRRALQDGRARADQGRPARRPAGVRQRDQPRRGEDQGHHVRGRRRSRHPAGARSRSRQHAGQAAQLPGQRRQRRPGAGRARAGHPDQPRRQRAVADRQLRRGGAGGPCPPSAARSATCHGRLRTRPQRRLVEPEVLRLPPARAAQLWRSRRAARSTASGRRPASPPRTAAARVVLSETLDDDRSRRPAALDGLAAWLRSRYAGARVLGVGHRVVHGGATYAGPVIVTPEVLEDLRALVPLAPLHQPHNLAAIEAVADGCPACRRSPASTPASIAASRRSRSWCRCRASIRDARRAALRLPRALVRVHRVGAAGRRARDRQTGA